MREKKVSIWKLNALAYSLAIAYQLLAILSLDLLVSLITATQLKTFLVPADYPFCYHSRATSCMFNNSVDSVF